LTPSEIRIRVRLPGEWRFRPSLAKAASLKWNTVLWLRKEMPEVTRTHQRICIDSAANILTVYWMTALGTINSKSFRTASGQEEWLASQLA
jgi:hypothetical protein